MKANKYVIESCSLFDSFWGQSAPRICLAGRAGPATLPTTTPSGPSYDRNKEFNAALAKAAKVGRKKKRWWKSVYRDQNKS